MPRLAVRAAAAALLALVAVHLLWLFAVAGESPVWFNGMFLAQRSLGLPSGEAGRAIVGLAFAAGALAVAWAWWARSSRLAALAFAAAAAWEIHFRFGQYQFVVGQGWDPAFPILFGLAMAAVSVLVAAVALVATTTHHWRRRSGALAAA